MITVYRITRLNRKDDLSGLGSIKFPGRWNRNDNPVIYCSESVAGAYLELLAYINENFPKNNPAVLLYIQIPDGAIKNVSADQLPEKWQTYPYTAVTRDLGCKWLKSKTSLALRVPSALAPDTNSILLNPRHPDFHHVKIIKHQSIIFDLRFFDGY